jgi:hypothetical protein
MARGTGRVVARTGWRRRGRGLLLRRHPAAARPRVPDRRFGVGGVQTHPASGMRRWQGGTTRGISAMERIQDPRKAFKLVRTRA